MDLNDIVQHAPLVLYLLAVFLLSVHLFPRPANAVSFLYILLALGALGTTWYYMFAYLVRHYQDAGHASGLGRLYTTTAWLEEHSLFKDAWHYVCETPERWFFSSQLCVFTTGVWTVFLFVEGSRHPSLRNKAWRYMVLGQIVAISFASSLFLAALSNVHSPRSSQKQNMTSKPRASITLIGAVIFALASVMIVPYTIRHWTFLPNLLAMHAIIILPLVLSKPGSRKTPASSARNLKTLYVTIGMMSLVIHLRTHISLLAQSSWNLQKLGTILSETLFVYPAQSSISFDILWTSGISQVWAILETIRLRSKATVREILLAIVAIAVMPTIGAGASMGFFLALREGWIERPILANNKSL